VRPHRTQDLSEAVDKSPHKLSYESRANEVPDFHGDFGRLQLTVAGEVAAVCDSDRISCRFRVGIAFGKSRPSLSFRAVRQACMRTRVVNAPWDWEIAGSVYNRFIQV